MPMTSTADGLWVSLNEKTRGPDEAAKFVGMFEGLLLREEPAVRVCDQDVGERHAGSVERGSGVGDVG